MANQNMEELPYIRQKHKYHETGFHGQRRYRVIRPSSVGPCNHDEMALSAVNQWSFTARCTCGMNLSLWWLTSTESEQQSKAQLLEQCRMIARVVVGSRDD